MIFRRFGMIILFISATVVSADDADATTGFMGISWSGLGSLEAGQLVKWHWRGEELDHTWLQQTKVRLVARKEVTPWLDVVLGFEGAQWFETYDEFSNNPVEIPQKNFSFIIHQSEAFFDFGDLLKIHCGVFPYKYNPEVQNLGEYLFRTGAYPGFIINEFDFAIARLTGLWLNNRLLDGKLNNDVIFNMETDYKPFRDISVSYIGSYSPHPAITLGYGVNLSHLISVNEKFTTPKLPGSWYIDSTSKDTVNLTFRGVKPMVRLTFDIKRFFDMPIFGSEDLKLYGELAILGVKNYQLYYDTLAQRIPIMFGFNFPAFKILDVMSWEFEWYGSPYPNSYQNAFSIQPYLPRPIPDLPQKEYSDYDYLHDNWKWSVYAKKTFANSFSIIGQVARDHFRSHIKYPYNIDREEGLTKPGPIWYNGHWYWMLKVA
ncbi:MAG: hypothetical protein JW863_21350, partial [Chitinispirillaceae bacterium]|nr:hypothetical protein [Chitinispirillaceae bacterium]